MTTEPLGAGRASGSTHLRLAVIGAGMAGILSAITLRQAGLDDFCVYEKADGVGGTWRDNTYPGIGCDVPSHLYSYSFALNPEWSATYSPGSEIQSYFQAVARRHQIERCISFNDEVVRCHFAEGRWHLTTAAGRQDHVDVVIAATGVLHHPRYPDIEGLDSFGGACFHSARWDHDAQVRGAKVGVIGTGSSGVQIVSALVPQVARLSLFQRSAQWIMPVPNPPYSEEERQAWRANPQSLAQLHEELGELFDGFSNSVIDARSAQMAAIEAACLANLEDSVTDPELRQRLRPDYRAACKRLVVSPHFYGAIQQANAELVTEGIERIEPQGVRTLDGRLHPLDVLVLATGFQVDAFMRPMEVVGRGGVTLEQAWAQRPQAYLSISIPDFPNLFMVNGPNGPVGNFSLIEVAELQVGYIMALVDELRGGRCREISATHQALEEFEAARLEASTSTIWSTGCKSWYLDDRGVPAVWPWPFARFRAEMAGPDLGAFDRRP